MVDKIRVGVSMSTKWTDPPMMLIAATACVPATIAGTWYLWKEQSPYAAAAVPVVLYGAYKLVYLRTGRANTTDYVEMENKRDKARWGKNRIPLSELYEGYIDGRYKFTRDTLATLREYRDFTVARPTWSVFSFLLRQFVPILSSTFHDKRTTKREIADHYDRGNDFFAAFLGPSMVYTSGVFHSLDDTLEQAQENKLALICDKLQLQKGHRFLDIGCGWGTLTRFAASRYGAHATGVTLSVEGAKWCKEKNAEERLNDSVEILTMDYRDIPKDRKFDRISAIEMAEHVGIKNFQLFLSQIRNRLDDQGLFLMQVAGLRQGANWQDVAWGLFMARYIFPGADASTPLAWYIHQLELAGFEVRSVENIGRHYSHTITRWYQNFLANKAGLAKTYPARLLRLWEFFLAWSVVASGQGSAVCYQMLCFKSEYGTDRDMFIRGGPKATGTGVGVVKK